VRLWVLPAQSGARRPGAEADPAVTSTTTGPLTVRTLLPTPVGTR